jgi:hypothetical protein
MINIPAVMAEIEVLLKSLEASLQREVDGPAISLSKLPFKAECYRESLAWRMADLSRGAFSSFQNNRLASAIALTRSAMETATSSWCLSKKIKEAIDNKSLNDINDYLIKGLVGWRLKPEDGHPIPDAHQVLKFIDKMDKEIPEFRKQYELLSEYAHPNWSGTHGLFAEIDKVRCVTKFGDKENITSLSLTLPLLASSLEIFIAGYNTIADLMPSFIVLSESILKRA